MRKQLSILQKTSIVIGVFFVVLIALNFNFFWLEFRYYLLEGQISVYKNPASSQPVNPKMAANTLVIESLRIKAPIVYASQASENEFQKALLDGVVHYPGTANPGQSGNCYIFGHSSDFFWSSGHYKTVFALLPQIEKGAEINISDQNGNEYFYVVTGTNIIAPTDLKYLAQDNSKKMLTLQTSYPVGTALKRFIVLAELRK